jgi:hypothetical protein
VPPSHGHFYHRHQPGGFSSDDAITTPMLHAWTSSSSNSSNGFVGSNVNNKRLNQHSSSCSSSSSVVKEDRGKQSFTLPETFVDEGVSFVRFATRDQFYETPFRTKSFYLAMTDETSPKN